MSVIFFERNPRNGAQCESKPRRKTRAEEERRACRDKGVQ